MRGQSKYVTFLFLTLALLMLASSQLGLVVWISPAEASPDTPDTGTIAYGEGTVATPKHRKWDGSTLGSEQTGPTMAATIRYVVLKSNPIRNEKMLVVSEDGGDVYASALKYGAIWITNKTLGTTILSDATCRGFHVAYEQSSGDCMIVVRSGTEVKYWIWDGLSWAVDGTTLDLTVTSGDPVWIELASDPLSDEIALIWSADSNEVGGAIWSGSAWGNQVLLESGATVITSDMLATECIAVEYMTNNGKAMFTWGADDKITDADCAVGTRVWNGATWDSLAYIPYGPGRDTYPPFWLSLKADPNSNQLMLGVTDDDSDFNTIRWSGAAWDAQVEHDGSIETEDSRCADIEWENASGHSGHAIATWNTGADHVWVKHWDGANWGTASSTGPIAGVTDQKIHQLRRMGDGKIFLSMVDDASGLVVWYWNHTTQAWTTSGSGLGEIETSVSATQYEPFEFAPDSVDALPSIYVTPSSIVDYNIGTGQSFSVQVKAADFIDLYGVDFLMRYDTSVLTATSIDETNNIFEDGEKMPDYMVWKKIINDTAGAGGPGMGRIWFGMSEALGELKGVNGSGRLCTITFSIDAPGESNLDIYAWELTDSLGVLLTNDAYDGYFRNAAIVRMDPASTTINGTAVSTFYVDVNVTWALNLRSYAFNITYDTNKLTAADVTQGDIFMGQSLTETINDAKGWVYASSTRPSDFTGDGDLAQVEFHTDYVANTSTLHFFQADLNNATGSIQTRAYDGSAMIIGAIVSVSPIFQSVGAPFDVNITVQVAVSLYTWEFNLTYDTSILTATGVTFGPFLPGGGSTTNSSTINDAAGWVWANSTLTGAVPGVTGASGVLATIDFTIDAIGITELIFQEAKLAKPAPVRLPCSTVPGRVSATVVVPEFPLGAAVEITLVMAIVYVWWKRRDRVKIN